jgi:hypothetical protein
MNTTTARHIVRIAPLVVAIALSTGGCGTPWAAGSNASATTSSSATDNAANSNAANSNAANSSAPQPVAQSAPGGQSGVSGATSGGSAPAPPGPSGPPGGASADSAATSGMSADDVAQYCKLSGDFSAMGGPEELSAFYFGEAAKPLVDLKKHTPVQLLPDVQLLYSDYEALANQSRVFPQVKDEVDASYKRVMDFNNQICQVH